MTVEPGRRERKKQRTREALSAAALRLAVERGLDEVTVEQIADEADVAVRTFRNYFSCKEEAAVATAEVGATALITLFRARPDDEPVGVALHAAVVALVDEGAMTAPEQVAVLRLVHRSPSLEPERLALLARAERALAAAIAERATPRADPSTGDAGAPARAAAAVFAVLRIVLDRWLDRPEHADGPAAPVDHLRTELAAAVHDLAAGLDATFGRP